MERALVQSTPNFSEGRRPEVIEALVGAIAACSVRILSVSPDARLNRTIIGLAGTPEQVRQAAVRSAEVSVRLIDLTQHRGAYPRMGAVDVIPIMPVLGCDLSECADMARQIGHEIAAKLDLPVFLYEEAAQTPGRRALDRIRKHQFEGLKELIGKDPMFKPDYGPDRIHPTAGCVAVGARLPTVVMNLHVTASDGGVLDRLVGELQEAGVLSRCRIHLLSRQESDRTILQVHVADYRANPLHKVHLHIRSTAAACGVSIGQTEFLGSIPAEALVDIARVHLDADGLSVDQVLERLLLE